MRSTIIALGSNVGNRLDNIKRALSAIKALPTTRITDTSFVYETDSWPAGTRQAKFLNSACRVDTLLPSQDLLYCLQRIEQQIGRRPSHERWHVIRAIGLGLASELFCTLRGPREIDLDIIASLEMRTDRLVLPHPLAHRREFVLRPLADIDSRLRLPGQDRSVSDLLGDFPPSGIARVVPVGGSVWRLGSRTYVMGIVNVTPDSFSDGGLFSTTELAAQAAIIQWNSGADIVDIGGQSTRPGADMVSVDEELSRVIPVIKKLRLLSPLTLISVDTFHALVARRAVEAGAHMVNDVSGGTADPMMIETISRLEVPFVCMHMRGDPKTMSSLNTYADLHQEITDELNGRVNACLNAGVYRHNVIADPGVGFSKNSMQNVKLLARRPDWVWPSLIGPSRKRFLGEITGKLNPRDRDFGTAAALAASIAAGYDIVRVHNVPAAVDVCRVADSVWRRLDPPLPRSVADLSGRNAVALNPDV